MLHRQPVALNAAANLLCCLAVAVLAPVCLAAEPPPPQGSRLHFQRTLSVHESAGYKVFTETRRVDSGDTLWEILVRDYRIPEDALPAFVTAFRQVNPGVDPDQLAAGQVLKVPFKVEDRFDAGERQAPTATSSYTVRAGDSLWRILSTTYGVSRNRMGAALAAVGRANPQIRDLNLILVGQRIAIPGDLNEPEGTRAPEPEAASAPAPRLQRPVLALLEQLRCRILQQGELFLPVSRGRSVRLDARDFPQIEGPQGAKVLLDPGERLSAALAASIEGAWGYRVVRGLPGDAEAQLARILPLLGFHDLAEGTKTIVLGSGVELLALARWTVVPRPEDLWEGAIHLLFSGGSRVDPGLAAAAERAGFILHGLDVPTALNPVADLPPLATLPMADAAEGCGRLLALLGVSHRVRSEVECELGGGVRYRIRPLLTFHHAGIDYAVPPPVPPRAEAILARAGYFTVTWPEGGSALNRLGDLLALLGVPHARVTVEAPQEQALRVRAVGIVVDRPGLAEMLYPATAGPESSGRLFLTEAQVSDAVAAALLRQDLLPWVVRTGPP